MSLEAKLTAFAEAVGVDIGELVNSRGDLTQLTTTNKASLVEAVNEVKTAVDGIDTSSVIDDAGDGTTVDKTWSSAKIIEELANLKDQILGGAPESYDTLKEIADYLANNTTQADALLEALGKRVRFDEAQTLTGEQQLTACTNIGIGDPGVDLAAAYTAAKNNVINPPAPQPQP